MVNTTRSSTKTKLKRLTLYALLHLINIVILGVIIGLSGLPILPTCIVLCLVAFPLDQAVMNICNGVK